MSLPKTLYHYTRISNLPSILEEGLIPDKGISSYYPTTYTYAAGKLRNNRIWMDTKLYRIKTRGNAVLSINVRLLDLSKLEKAVSMGRQTPWYVYRETIPPRALSLVEKLD